MNYKKVFVDANVILDLFIPDRPFSEYSVTVIDWLSEKASELFTSCDLITTVYYVLARRNKNKALRFIEATTEIFTLIPFSNEELLKATEPMRKDRKFKDLEDTIQYVLAKKECCDLILTNDEKFSSPDIEVITTKKFYRNFIQGNQ